MSSNKFRAEDFVRSALAAGIKEVECAGDGRYYYKASHGGARLWDPENSDTDCWLLIQALAPNIKFVVNSVSVSLVSDAVNITFNVTCARSISVDRGRALREAMLLLSAFVGDVMQRQKARAIAECVKAHPGEPLPSDDTSMADSVLRQE